MTPSAARKYVALRLGHGRDAVTRIYLVILNFKGSRQQNDAKPTLTQCRDSDL
jgi:hypothetical protein